MTIFCFRDYEKSKRRRYSNQEAHKDEPEDPEEELSTKNLGSKVKEAVQQASQERCSLAVAEAKNLKMENKELQKNSEIQMKKMEEMRRKNEELEKTRSLLEGTTKEQQERISNLIAKCIQLEKERNTLEEEKRNQLAKYRKEIENERDELDDQLTELQVKYKEAQEHLKKAQLNANTAISGDDEELNMLRSKCSELELELKSKNAQLDAQEIDLKSKEEKVVELEDKVVKLEEKIVKLEEIKQHRSKIAIAYGDRNKEYIKLQKAKDELQKTAEEKENYCAEIQKTFEGERLELQKAADEKNKECERLQKLLYEKQKLLDEKQIDNVQLSGERDVLEKNIKQNVLTQLATLETVKAECSREKEERERISAKADLLEKKLIAKEAEITALLGQKESVVAAVDQPKKKVTEKETESARSLASEKKKAVDEAAVLKRRLEAAEMELGNLRQSVQLNNHSMESSGKNKDKDAMDIKMEALQAALVQKEKLIEALKKELAANQDHLRKVIRCLRLICLTNT